MGCAGSDGEDELRLSSRTSTANKRFKFHKKFTKDECSNVCLVSVPRKLRSAMKKRSQDKVSPLFTVSKKLNHVADGVASPRKDGSMNSKMKMKQHEAEGCVSNSTLGPVTKDEEEAAEALYALAGVFSNAVKTDKSRFAAEGMEAISSNLTKSFATPSDDSIEIAVGNLEEELKTISYKDEAPNHLSNPVRSAGESVMLHCQIDTRQPDISVGKQAIVESGGDIAEINLPLKAFNSEKQQTIRKAKCDPVVSGDSTELSKTRSKFPNLEKSLANSKYPTTIIAPSAPACSQVDVQQTIKEIRNNGPSLRPDSSSASSCDSQRQEISLKSRIASLPAWFESTSRPAQSPKLESSVVAKKDAQVAFDSKNSWKRCIAHVYISQFIKVFQISERKNRSMMQSNELTTNGAPKQGSHITFLDQTAGKNATPGVVWSDSCSGSSAEKNATEVRNAILLHKRLSQDQKQAYTPHEVYAAQKQSLEFLSLPAGSHHLEACNGNSRAGHGMEISTQLRFPGLLSRNQPIIPFPVAQNGYSSTSFSSNASVAALQKVVQVPPNVGSSSYCPTLMDATASSAQQLEQQQQQNRAPLFMANYMSGVASPSIPNKQTEGPNLPPIFQHVQTIFPPSLPSLEVHGARYAPALQQQQQLLMSGNSLLPSPTVKGQYHPLPSVYEASVGGSRSDNVPLRIICNQYI